MFDYSHHNNFREVTMKHKINVFFIFISLIAISLTSCERYHGEIFTKEVANQKFGKIQESVELPAKVLRSLLGQTDNNIMFRIVDGNVIILDNNRNVIYPADIAVNPTDVFSMFSVSVVNDLLSNGDYPNVNIEGRGTALTITYGDKTMEVATLCPPICD
jgi:hypothetical protein